jgi:hypothetical protein
VQHYEYVKVILRPEKVRQLGLGMSVMRSKSRNNAGSEVSVWRSRTCFHPTMGAQSAQAQYKEDTGHKAPGSIYQYF